MTITVLQTNYLNGDIFSASDINATNTVVNLLSASQSLIAAKGDLLSGSTDDTLVKTSVGSNNTVLYADSTQTGGINWGQVTSSMIATGTVTNANLAGSIAYSKLVLTGAITNADLAGSISDSKLSTISTAGKVANSATTATSANTASAIVARDSNGDSALRAITLVGKIFATDYNNALSTSGATTNGEGVIRVGKYTGNVTAITTNADHSSGTSYHISFYRQGSNVGSISDNGTTTSFNTTSDYRLKENIRNLSDSLSLIERIAPKTYNFKADPSTTYHGFIAHELAEVVPYAVIGEKDATSETGDIIPQQIDYSKLTALVVAAIQELADRITRLENR